MTALRSMCVRAHEGATQRYPIAAVRSYHYSISGSTPCLTRNKNCNIPPSPIALQIGLSRSRTVGPSRSPVKVIQPTGTARAGESATRVGVKRCGPAHTCGTAARRDPPSRSLSGKLDRESTTSFNGQQRSCGSHIWCMWSLRHDTWDDHRGAT